MTKLAKKAKSFDAFIHAVLDPLPDEALQDTHYNALARQSRAAAWRRANAETRYYEALLEFIRAEYAHHRSAWSEEEEPVRFKAYVEKDIELVAIKRAAVARQIMTPSFNKAGIAWKRKAATDQYLPISEEQIEAAIASDEAFLDAHPVKRVESKRINALAPRRITVGGANV